MIYTTDAYMASIGNATANVSKFVAPASKCAITLNHNTTAIADIRNVFSIDAGIAVYYSIAPWNQATYTANGFGGLSWSDWKLIGASLDDSNSLSGNIRFNTSTDTTLDLVGKTGNIIAFGVSSTLIPPSWVSIVPTPDANTGVPTINYTKGFTANTVIFDAAGNVGNGTYQVPGITASNVLINGQADSWLNYRFFV
jgi:hypothetical protein